MDSTWTPQSGCPRARGCHHFPKTAGGDEKRSSYKDEALNANHVIATWLAWSRQRIEDVADPRLASSYVLLLLRYCYFNRMFANVSDGMGINHLGAGRLAHVVVPLAPELEQRMMVEEVERQLESIKASQRSIDSNMARASDLRAAVLSQAFRGELVDPKLSGESAHALVERISLRRVLDLTVSPPEAQKTRIPKMKVSTTRKPLLDVLREHPDGITPEALLTAANYTIDDVDRFYIRSCPGLQIPCWRRSRRVRR
jgi:hypothetical protein